MPAPKPILLVDDDLNDIELVTRTLRKTNLKNEVVTARHGGEALDFLHRMGAFAGRAAGNPLFILLDLKMPKVDGIEVLKEIKADEKLKMIPVVMLTSSKEQNDLLLCYRLGVNAYVVKPVDFTEFVDVIRHLAHFWGEINESPPDSKV